jgi:TetR/AcrR family transcriptional regulator, regulator of autoinduction and epiphytic fitness
MMTSLSENNPPSDIAKRPARGRPDKKDIVLDAGVRAFLDTGYSATTLDSIAHAAGTSTATVFKHYRTKADIFGAIMSRIFDSNDVFPWPDLPDNDLRGSLRLIGHQYANTMQDPDIRALFRVMIAEVPRFPELGEQLYEKGKAPYLSRVENYLASQVLKGNFRNVNIRLATRQFLGMINDVLFWPHMLVVGLATSTDEVVSVVESAVDVIMAAYAIKNIDGLDVKASTG